MGRTALQLAIEKYNLPLADFLFAQGGRLADVEMAETNTKNQQTILHDLVSLPFNVYRSRDQWSGKYGPSQQQIKVVTLFNKLASIDPERVKGMLRQMDKNGLTPMLLACTLYTGFDANQFQVVCYSFLSRNTFLLCACFLNGIFCTSLE
jgi:hypothetical protein